MNESLDRKTGKKRVLSLILIFTVLIFIILFLGFRFYSLYEGKTTTESDKFLFGITYLQILLVIGLGFVVGRNVVKLVFDYRNKVLGAKLRTRLLLALVGITLIPTFLLYVIASGLLDKAFEGWFSNKIESAIDASVLLSRKSFLELKSQVTRSVDELSSSLARKPELFEFESAGKKQLLNVEALSDYLEDYRKNKGFYRIALLQANPQNGKSRTLLEVTHPTSSVSEFKEPKIADNVISSAAEGSGQIISDLESAGQFIRAVFPVNIQKGTQEINNNPDSTVSNGKFILILSYRIDPELAEAFSAVQDSYTDIGQLKIYKKPLQTSYGITLILVTTCVMFAAVWLAFSIARYITGPIEELAFATEQVSKGNFNVELKSKGSDEISYLINSFNQMTSDLALSQKIAQERRILIETVLKHVTVGVIQVTKDGEIQTVNPAAEKIYNLSGGSHGYSSKPIQEVFQHDDYLNLKALLEAAKLISKGDVIEKDLKVISNGRELKLICRVGKIFDDRNEWKDIFIILTDITDVTKAQAMSAWREVARRIAHEIKNPLTPIQLSAERLAKLFEGGDFSASVNDSVKHIVENVESIKRLANEFSNFARMPTAILKPEDVNQLVHEVVENFSAHYSGIIFQFIPDNSLELQKIDREQIRRVLINLIENASNAIRLNSEESGKIVVRTKSNPKSGKFTLEVIDNGVGIKPEEKSRIFEPYFTTKKGGTGLGLAIVSSIINDHGGQVKVFDNQPRGTRFVVDVG